MRFLNPEALSQFLKQSQNDVIAEYIANHLLDYHVTEVPFGIMFGCWRY